MNEGLPFVAILIAAAAVWRFSPLLSGSVVRPGADSPQRWRTTLVLAADIASALCATTIVMLLGWRMGHRWRKRLYATVLGCLLFWLIAVGYSQSQFGVALTLPYAMLGLRWFVQRSTATSPSAPFWLLARLLVIPIAIWLWCALSGDLATRPARRRRAASSVVSRARVAGVIGAFLIIEAIPIVLPRHASYPSLVNGVWIATVVTFFRHPEHDPLRAPTVPVERLRAEWERVVEDEGRSGPTTTTTTGLIPALSIRQKRHVVVIELETAPLELYPIAGDSTLPTFFELARTSIVGAHHHTTSLATTWSVYSMVTGMYALPGRPISCYGHIDDDASLPAALAANGYETTFIDSFRADWAGGNWNSRMLHELGFQNVIDGSLPPNVHPAGEFEFFEAIERHSFSEAATAVVTAQSHGRRSLVFISTSLGHFPLSQRANAHRSNPEQQAHDVAAAIDSALSNYLAIVDQHGLRDSLIVVVTGDHGLRFPSEFAYANRPTLFGDLSNTVPFILHVPRLMDHQIAIPFATSHVDITPTLLDLIGVQPPNDATYHGRSLFDWPAAGRWSFTWNTDLAPTDFAYGPPGAYSIDRLTGAVVDSRGARADNQDTVRARTEQASRLIDMSAGLLLRSGERRRGPLDARSACLGG
jgi:hypothetical protein